MSCSPQETYFELINKVGSRGRYQWMIYFLILYASFLVGMSTNSIAYLFKGPEFDCTSLESAKDLSKIECETYICSNFNSDQWKQYTKEAERQTLNTEFGPYVCSNSYIVGSIRGISFFGSFFGVFLSIFVSDNFSRRKAFLLCCCFLLISYFILSQSRNIYMAALGLFGTGLGAMPVTKMSSVILSEITQKSLKQRFLASYLVSHALGVLTIGYIFSIFKDWRDTVTYFGLFPNLLLVVICYCILEETPKYILRNHTAEQAARILNRIAKINGEFYRYSPQELFQKINQQGNLKNIKSVVTPADLFVYKSLRTPTMLFCVSASVADIIYFSHNFVADSIGVNMEFNMMVFGVGDVLGIFFSVVFVQSVRRVKTGVWLLVAITILIFVADLIAIPNQCEFCMKGLFQIFLFGIQRTLLMFWWCLFFVHLVQFFPVSIRNIGVGCTAATSSLALYLNEFIMTALKEQGVNLLYYVIVMGLIGILAFARTPETKDREEKDQIEEIKKIYMKQQSEAQMEEI